MEVDLVPITTPNANVKKKEVANPMMVKKACFLSSVISYFLVLAIFFAFTIKGFKDSRDQVFYFFSLESLSP